MSKLYFKYGAMGSSKSAAALMCKFNYEQKGMKVLLLKPSSDVRDMIEGEIVIKSRIGLFSKCFAFDKSEDIEQIFNDKSKTNPYDVVIIDECQFMTEKQINQCKNISRNVPVLCYGLLTNFKTKLFEGSKRLVEIADSLTEIKSVCACGRKANINARFVNGIISTMGEEIAVGNEEGELSYESMCYTCYMDRLIKDTSNN